MTSNIPSKIEEIKKGCGKPVTPNIPDGVCGNNDFNNVLCIKCQARLQALEEAQADFIKMIDELWKDKKMPTYNMLFLDKFRKELKAQLTGGQGE